MIADLFASFLHALPLFLGAIICIFALYGFWRGLRLKPHGEGHRPRRWHTWWGGRF
jgi:hypothetical protein